MDEQILAQEPPEQPPRRRREEVEEAERRFADTSMAFYLLAHEGRAPERLERASKVMDEAAKVLR
jgi:hypothetical protein